MKPSHWRWWVVSLATLLTMGITATLGLWQLDRARQKEALQRIMDERQEGPSLSVGQVLAEVQPESLWHRPVNLEGVWEPGKTLFLDNRQMNSRNGFFVLTPLRLRESDRSILVQRGWVARDFIERTRVPEIDTPAGIVQVQGRLAPPPARLWSLGEELPGPIRQNVDLGDMTVETGQRLLPGLSVLQTGSADAALLKNWHVVASGVHKHHGYAAQWFGLCALTGILYAWFQWISPRRKQRQHGLEDQ